MAKYLITPILPHPPDNQALVYSPRAGVGCAASYAWRAVFVRARVIASKPSIAHPPESHSSGLLTQRT
jgi:hypothetical protein